jgi:hypothetical protein
MESNISKIYYKHWRYPKFSGVPMDMSRYHRWSRGATKIVRWSPTCKGGKTLCVIRLTDGRHVVGYAFCSKEDNFEYRIGRQIARGRAEKQLQKLLDSPTDCDKIE